MTTRRTRRDVESFQFDNLYWDNCIKVVNNVTSRWPDDEDCIPSKMMGLGNYPGEIYTSYGKIYLNWEKIEN